MRLCERDSSARLVPPPETRARDRGADRQPAGHAHLLLLQRQVGNAGVVRLLAAGSRAAAVQRCGPTPCDCTDEERARKESAAAGDAVQRAPEGQGMTPEQYEAAAAALCLGDRYNVGPPSRAFTPREQSIVSATRWAALSLAGRAVQALSSHDRYMATLARRIFHEPNPDLEELAATAARIHDALASTPVVCGTCTNPVCGHAAGGSPLADADNGIITICPYFFHESHSLLQQRRTWLHEAGHIAGIDDPPPGTPYTHPANCPVQTEGTCEDPCPQGNKNNVDAWARFIECVAFRY